MFSRKFWFLVSISRGSKWPFWPPCKRPWLRACTAGATGYRCP